MPPKELPHTAEGYRSGCPLACTLDIIGDKWSLLVIRDLFLGKKRYQEFLASPEGIASNILTARLRRLEGWGIVDKTPYTQNPLRYEYALTERGKAMEPIMREILRWGRKYLPDETGPMAQGSGDRG
jgi:DNA-binding HxlR family transcriptional regulator